MRVRRPGGGNAAMTAKKLTATAERRPSLGLESFEKGVKAMGKRDFARAAEIFGELIAAYPGERELLERARSYQTLCARAVEDAKRPSFRPKSIEETLNHAVY